MTAFFVIVFAAVGMLGCLYGGFKTGYDLGVNDTERRWSDVCKKAEWERRYGTSTVVGGGRDLI